MKKSHIVTLLGILLALLIVTPAFADEPICTPGELISQGRTPPFACWSNENGETSIHPNVNKYSARMKTGASGFWVYRLPHAQVGESSGVPWHTEFYASCAFEPGDEPQRSYWYYDHHCRWLAVKYFDTISNTWLEGYALNDSVREGFELLETRVDEPVIENGCIEGRTQRQHTSTETQWISYDELCVLGFWQLDPNSYTVVTERDPWPPSPCAPGEVKYHKLWFQGGSIYNEVCWTLPNGEQVMKPDIVGYFANLIMLNGRTERWRPLVSLDGQTTYLLQEGDRFEGTCVAYSFRTSQPMCRIFAVRFESNRNISFTGFFEQLSPYSTVGFVSENENWLPLPSEGCPEGRTRFDQSEICSSGEWVLN